MPVVQKAAKEFYKMEGKKPPTKVEDVDIFEKNNPSNQDRGNLDPPTSMLGLDRPVFGVR